MNNKNDNIPQQGRPKKKASFFSGGNYENDCAEMFGYNMIGENEENNNVHGNNHSQQFTMNGIEQFDNNNYNYVNMNTVGDYGYNRMNSYGRENIFNR